MFKRVILLMAVLFLGACSMFGVRSETEPSYRVILEEGDYQIRQYDSYVIAETFISSDFDKAGNKAFKKLFAYISGDNVNAQEIAMTSPVLANRESTNRQLVNQDPEIKGQKIAMTAPVIANKAPEGWHYAFVLPKKFSLDSAPVPTNPDVKLKTIQSKKVAVIQYTGLSGEDVFNDKTAQLLIWLKDNNLDVVSSPSFASYDPPWTLPFYRRNEILIDVKN